MPPTPPTPPARRPPPPVKVVSYGVILDDIVFPDGRTQMAVLGGGGVQTCWGAAVALPPRTVAGLAARVGVDLPPDALDPLARAGVDLDGVTVTPHPTPRTWQLLEWDGLRRFLWRNGSAALAYQLERGPALLPERYTHAAWFHIGLDPNAPADDIAWAKALRALGGRVSFEPFTTAHTPLPLRQLRALLSACDVFSPNSVEAASMVGGHPNDPGTLAAHFREAGARVLALRRGDSGADIYDFTRTSAIHVGAVPVATVVNPVGAGNAFCGAFLARFDDGLELAASHAAAAASYMLEQVGIPPGGKPPPDEYAARLGLARRTLHALPMPSAIR